MIRIMDTFEDLELTDEELEYVTEIDYKEAIIQMDLIGQGIKQQPTETNHLTRRKRE